MPPSTLAPVPPLKPNLTIDIQILHSILHTIHNTSLITRQPTTTARPTSPSTVSRLESRLSKLSAALQKRESCGKKLQRLLTCRDREYEEFVALVEEIGEVYEGLLVGARPTPMVQQAPSPESSMSSSRSAESRDFGLWMKGSKGQNERRENVRGKSGDEQIEEQDPSSQGMGGSSNSSKSGSSSTVKASGVNSSKKVEGEISIDEQIQEWMKGRKGRQDRGEKREEEKPVQADF